SVLLEMISDYWRSFVFHDATTAEIYPLSLPDALPISRLARATFEPGLLTTDGGPALSAEPTPLGKAATAAEGWLPFRDHLWLVLDRKSTRLNSSHVKISYAVFCLKKKKKITTKQKIQL